MFFVYGFYTLELWVVNKKMFIVGENQRNYCPSYDYTKKSGSLNPLF